MLTIDMDEFLLLIDFDPLKPMTSTNTKPEVVLSDVAAILKIDMTSYFRSS